MVGAWKAAWDSGHAPTDFVGNVINTLQSNAAKEEAVALKRKAPEAEIKAMRAASSARIRAIKEAMETGALHSILMDFRPHFDKTGLGNRAMQRAQSIGQELSSSVDAINRIATFLAGYDLERASGSSHLEALRYTKDNLTQTQGLYTAANRASMLKNPMVRAAMQFRNVPMMIYNVIGKNIYTAFKGESKEVRWAAVKSLVGTMGTTAALGGLAAGVPEPIRLAVMLAHMFGLTDSWQQEEDKLRKYTMETMGDTTGRFLMDGILGAVGISAANRIGLNDLFIKGDPTSQSAKEFLFDTIVGAQGGYTSEAMKGVGQLLSGNPEKAIPSLLPIRMFSDIAKAYVENETGKPAGHGMPGMPPLDPYETFIKAMGGTPMREANYGKMTNLMREEHSDKAAATKAAVGGDMSAVFKWNTAHPKDRIAPSQIQKMKKEPKPRNLPLVQEYQRAYQ
jgi:hypothetical protein